MKFQRTLRRVAVALMLLVAFLFQGTWALAGTTGGLNGTVTDTKGAPVVGAVVVATSPSQVATATTDSHGHFMFLSLSPDTYTVTVKKADFNTASLSGVTVFADQNYTISLVLSPALKTIATVKSRAAGNLVKAGVTNNVYSVNAATQTAVQGIGGGGNLTNAYSALYATPGVSSYIGNEGFGQVFYIRGASYDQSGYEYDGVPVNRAFDNYNANSLSSLGQQELQIYTGSDPSGASSATQVGFINQVIRTGTYPGFADAQLGLGNPAYFHELKVETGGATPNRLFSYYVGFEGVNQQYNFINNQNGLNFPLDGSGSNGFSGLQLNFDTVISPFYFQGPWPTCNANGSGAPAGAPTFTNPNTFNYGVSVTTPVCASYVPFESFVNNAIADREGVVNLHFGIPHKRDAGRDDFQILYNTFAYRSYYNDSINGAFGGMTNMNNTFGAAGPLLNTLNSSFAPVFGPNAFGVPQSGPLANVCDEMGIYSGVACATTGPSQLPFHDGYIYPNGTSFGQSATGIQPIPYYMPGTNMTNNRLPNSGIAPNYQDSVWNDGSIIKLQYQKNINERSYLRLLGYTFYSDWLNGGPAGWGMYYDTFALGYSNALADYELNTHTRGVQLVYANQLNDKNLLTFTANYTTATTGRANNVSGNPNWTVGLNGPGSQTTNLTDGTNCYNAAGAVDNCYSSLNSGTYGTPTPYGVAAGSPAALAGATWQVTVPHFTGGYFNRVTPRFSSYALEDEFRPTHRWDLNIGLRLETYSYGLSTLNSPEMNFWFNQAQNWLCVDSGTGQGIFLPPSPTTAPGSINPEYSTTPGGADCTGVASPSGAPAVHPNGLTAGIPALTNINPSSITKSLVSPRISGTYTVNPLTVIRFSAGRFSQPTPTAFEQYYLGSGRETALTLFQRFYGIGFNSPLHDNPVQTSNNYDISLEKQLKGTDITFRLTPFYRYATNQSVTVPLGANFVSGLNVGTQKTSGIEFAIQKGDPSRNGLSGQISWTYVHARIKYGALNGSQSAIDLLNNYIRAYNGLTSFCLNNSSAAASGLSDNNPAHICPQGDATAGYVGAPASCYQPNGAGPATTPCGAASGNISNPYYSNTPQPILDRNGYYPTYANYPPGDPLSGAGSTAFGPNQFSAYLSYKKNKLTITPTAQLFQGSRYGDPTAVVGLDPRNCGSNQSGVAGVAAAYQGLPNYQSCAFSPYTNAGFLAIPDPATGKFDSMGQFRNPWQFNLGLQLHYDFTPKISGTFLIANLVNRCFGGSKQPWSNAYVPNQYVCGYYDNTGGYIGNTPGAGFFYGAGGTDPANGTAGYPGTMNYPYAPANGNVPLQAYFQLNVKL